MQEVHFRCDEELLEQIDERADDLGFTSRSEYLRYIARNDIQRGYRDAEV
jgi:metal-responsive CopG/Arc/MetJ family transcriptional regulator